MVDCPINAKSTDTKVMYSDPGIGWTGAYFLRNGSREMDFEGYHTYKNVYKVDTMENKAQASISKKPHEAS